MTRSSSLLRIWLLPLSVLLGGALSVFVFTFWVDASREGNPSEIWRLVIDPNPVAAAATLANVGEVVAAVLAIAVTVVAIVVELAANRYTHRITELFVQEPINFGVIGFFVVTALQALWVSLTFDYDPSLRTGFVPHFGVTVTMIMLAGCLLILLPYFGFVFHFLNPIQILSRIRVHTIKVVESSSFRWPAARKHAEAMRGIDQIADVGLNAMEHKDKGVCMASVETLKTLVIDYQGVARTALDESWFRPSEELSGNADFVSMSRDVLDDMARRKTWFELKVLRQYQTIYNEALNRMGDINCLVAISTRLIAESGIEKSNPELVRLCIKFLNTYLRSTINARDVRTAYNVLHQYRMLAERVLEWDAEIAIEIARHFKYYGLVSHGAKLAFILETVAHDLCQLIEFAFDRGHPVDRLLALFLEVDKEGEGDIQEVSLRGVRKAQVHIASYFLLHGREDLARRVYHDMEQERPERLRSIRDELMAVESSEFWEVVDRGVNFDYMPPAQKEKLTEFFAWFGSRIPSTGARASSLEVGMARLSAAPPPRVG